MQNVSNIFDYRKSVRVTQPDGRVGVIHFSGFSDNDGKRDVQTASSVVASSLGMFEMLDAINGLARNLRALRKSADEGDERARYDANIQISLIADLRGKMEMSGGRTRYISDSDSFELY